MIDWTAWGGDPATWIGTALAAVAVGLMIRSRRQRTNKRPSVQANEPCIRYESAFNVPLSRAGQYQPSNWQPSLGLRLTWEKFAEYHLVKFGGPDFPVVQDGTLIGAITVTPTEQPDTWTLSARRPDGSRMAQEIVRGPPSEVFRGNLVKLVREHIIDKQRG